MKLCVWVFINEILLIGIQQHIFTLRNKKNVNTFWLKNKVFLICDCSMTYVIDIFEGPVFLYKLFWTSLYFSFYSQVVLEKPVIWLVLKFQTGFYSSLF